MLLTIDVGNTSLTVGAFDGTELVARGRVSTARTRSVRSLEGQVERLCSGMRFDAVSVCSVVPPADALVRAYAASVAGERVTYITRSEQVPMPVRYDPPEALGADRIVNAYAAWRLVGGTCIAVDLGTATKFDAVTGEGVYIGGAIAPGLGVSTRALTAAAARLPAITLQAPASAIGGCTADALSSGAVYGHAAMIDGMVERFIRELGGAATVIATGGFAPLVCAHTRLAGHVEPFLTLQGLRLLASLDAAASSAVV